MPVPTHHGNTRTIMWPRAAIACALVLLPCVLLAEPAVPAPAGPDATPGELVVTAKRVEAREGPRGKEVILEEDVTLTRQGATLVADRGIYYESEGLALLFGHVHGVDGTSEIACDTLRYFRDLDRATLLGHASYADTSGVTRARRIEMYRREDIAVCVGDAVAVDNERTSELRAGRIIYDFESGRAAASGEPVLSTYTKDGTLDATLRAVVLEFDTGGAKVTAFGRVAIERGKVKAHARVATIERDPDRAVLEGEPTVEQESDVLAGDRILVFAEERKISRVVSIGRARAEYHIEKGKDNEEPQRGSVQGDTLAMHFEDEEPVLTTVRGHAVSEHFIGAAGERNEIGSEAIDAFFSEGRMERVVFRGPAEGTYYFVREEGAAEKAPVEGAPTGASAPAQTAGPPGEAAADSLALESVAYRAPQIDYYVGRNRIVLSGGAVVEYQKTVLTADEVVFDPDAQLLSATGSPDLTEEHDRLVGSRLAYDLDGHTGAIVDGATTFEEGLYYGDRIVRESDGALLVRGGIYTTCSADPPHYRLVSHRMKVYLDDKVIASPVILYIGEVPVFALPFYVFPIRKDRHSGFLIPNIELGISENRGRFIRNFGYYFAPSDYWDLAAWADYYEQTRWIGHAEARYKIRYVLSGSVTTSIMQELQNQKRRWDLQFSHRQELGRSWTAGASGEFRSDATYAIDTNQSIEESVNRSLHSQIWTRGRWNSLSVGVTLDRREELDQGTVSELLPKIDVTASQRPLLKSSGTGGLSDWLGTVTASWDAKVVNDRDRAHGATTVHQGVGVGASVATSGRLFGRINVSPRLSLRQNWYDRDKKDREFPGRFTYDASLSAGTTIYGTFEPRLGPVDAVRHIIEPSVTYSWTPEFPRYFDESGFDIFPTMSGFGATPRAQESVGLSLVQKLQLKVRTGEEVQKLDNLLRFSMSTSYDMKREDRHWADLSSLLELRPGPAVSVRWTTRHDPYDWGILNTTVTASLDLAGAPPPVPEDWEDRIGGSSGSPVEVLRKEVADREREGRLGLRPWDASLTFRHSRGATSEDVSSWGDARVALSLTPHWRINWSIHYDIQAAQVASQEYTIYRDLHCWEAQFTRRYYDGEWQYYFRIDIKAVPEIQAEAGQKYIGREVR